MPRNLGRLGQFLDNRPGRFALGSVPLDLVSLAEALNHRCTPLLLEDRTDPYGGARQGRLCAVENSRGLDFWCIATRGRQNL